MKNNDKYREIKKLEALKKFCRIFKEKRKLEKSENTVKMEILISRLSNKCDFDDLP